jgi:phosphoribosyl 1,2-cyclic phosphodiesterase
MLNLAILASGSAANSLLVSSESTRILIDAGLSATETAKRLRALDIHPATLQAVCITHAHVDHAAGVEGLVRSYRMPIYSTSGTRGAIAKDSGIIRRADWHCFVASEETLAIGDLTLMPFGVYHDAEEPVGYVIECGGARFAIATDLGYISERVAGYLNTCQTVLLESNHDFDTLAACDYPRLTKRRVYDNHLSNDQVRAFIQHDMDGVTQNLILGHISGNTNSPDLARLSALAALRGSCKSVRLAIATPSTELFSLDGTPNGTNNPAI